MLQAPCRMKRSCGGGKPSAGELTGGQGPGPGTQHGRLPGIRHSRSGHRHPSTPAAQQRQKLTFNHDLCAGTLCMHHSVTQVSGDHANSRTMLYCGHKSYMHHCTLADGLRVWLSSITCNNSEAGGWHRHLRRSSCVLSSSPGTCLSVHSPCLPSGACALAAQCR